MKKTSEAAVRLVLFDVDGTLTQTRSIDADCYARAVRDELGVEVDTDWESYRNVTDSGIVREILERHGPLSRVDADEVAVERRFLRYFRKALAADPAICRPVPGAIEVISRLAREPGVAVGVATGSWAESARLKLEHAEIDVRGLPIATADDSTVRAEIVELAAARAAAAAGVAGFERVVYVGDGPWDVRTAEALGFGFVGIACESGEGQLAAAGARVVLKDFSDPGQLLEAVRSAGQRAKRRRPAKRRA